MRTLLRGLTHPQSHDVKEFEEHVAGLKFIHALTRSISEKGSTQELAQRAASALALTDAEKDKRDDANRIIGECNEKQANLDKEQSEHEARVKAFEDYKKSSLENIEAYQARGKTELSDQEIKIRKLEEATLAKHASTEKKHIDRDFQLQQRESEVLHKLEDIAMREDKCTKHEASLSEREEKLQRHLDDLSRMRG